MYKLYTERKKVVVIFPVNLDRFSFLSNATNFFNHSLNRLVFFEKNAYVLPVSIGRVPYLQISGMIPRVNIVGTKVSVVSINGAGGSGVFREPSRGWGWGWLEG